jgi:hypothetical protein
MATPQTGSGPITSTIQHPDPRAVAPHVMVTWSNAITTRPGVSECFASRGDALIASGDRAREQWNNTRITMCWHEAHDRAAVRRARTAEHYTAVPAHVWGVVCRECAAITADRDESAALVAAARDAAGDQHLHAVTS